MSERNELFDSWAERYDDGLKGAAGFPFEGYELVLGAVVGGAGVEAGANVLDVGTGTGALAARFAGLGCAVTGVDFSEAMLAQARRNVPGADFRRLDLLGAWEGLEHTHFATVVSAYVLHEFDLGTKINLLTRLAALLTPGGRVVVGDVSFADQAARAAAHEAWQTVWDEDEDYWTAADDLPVLRQAGFTVSYRQVSFCAGVYTLEPFTYTLRR